MKQYINYRTYTDIEPYEVINSTNPRKLTVRAMKFELDPEWEPKWVTGGFAGCCINQDDQKWLIVPNEGGCVHQMSLRKNGKWQFVGRKTVRGGCVGYLETEPRRFYDFNF